jgi:hypothetical protein
LLIAAWLLAEPLHAQPSKNAAQAVDHLILGVSDLDAGSAWLLQQTGVRPVLGGVHPGRGTRNALVALGGRRYLEILAPDPAQSSVTFHPEIKRLQQPKLLAWAAGTDDIERLALRAREAGLQFDGPRDGSRERPDGSILRWEAVTLAQSDGPVPFFIHWGQDSRHPSQDSPKGCVLESLELKDPKPDELKALLEKVSLAAEVTRSDRPGLQAVLRTPKGHLRLD